MGLLSIIMGLAEEYYKFVMLGNSGTGKTELIKAMVGGDAHDNSIVTIGVDFKTCTRTEVVAGREIKTKYRIWDTAGQERFRGITSSYFRGADCVLITGRDRRSVSVWKDECAAHLPTPVFYTVRYEAGVPRLEDFTSGNFEIALLQGATPAAEQGPLAANLLVALTAQLRSLAVAAPVVAPAAAAGGAGAGARTTGSWLSEAAAAIAAASASAVSFFGGHERAAPATGSVAAVAAPPPPGSHR